MQTRPLLILAALAAASEPDFGRAALERLKDGLRGTYNADPMGSTLGTVLVASLLFYKAERGANPKVTSLYDALVFVSKNLSAGYCDIVPTTAAGKAVGSALATFGPAMTAGLLAEPTSKTTDEPDTRAVVERLDRILAVLEARSAGTSSELVVP